MPILIATVMSTVVKGRENYYHSILFCNLKKMNKLKKKMIGPVNEWLHRFYLVLEISKRLY